MRVRQGAHQRGLRQVGAGGGQCPNQKEYRDVAVVFSRGGVGGHSDLAQRTHELICCARVHFYRLRLQAEVDTLGGLRRAGTALKKVTAVAVAEEGEPQGNALLLERGYERERRVRRRCSKKGIN